MLCCAEVYCYHSRIRQPWRNSSHHSQRPWIVSLSGTGEEDNAFRLHNGEHELLYTVTQDGKTLAVGDTVLSAAFGAATKSAELAFALATKRPYPGTYTGNVAFTVNTSHVDRRTVTIPGIGYIRAAAGSKNVAVQLYNPEENPCLFAYEIVLDDTKETLWKSEQNHDGTSAGSRDLSGNADRYRPDDGRSEPRERFGNRI